MKELRRQKEAAAEAAAGDAFKTEDLVRAMAALQANDTDGSMMAAFNAGYKVRF